MTSKELLYVTDALGPVSYTHLLNKQVILALQQLREGNADSFADGIADCYRYNLSRMKKHMVEKYKFRNVAYIRVPEKY